jgi:acyl carrier protein
MVEDIKRILEEVKGIPGYAQSISAQSNIIQDIALDSLEMLNFILKVESELGVEIDFEKLSFTYFQSIQSFCDFLDQTHQKQERLAPIKH